MYRQKRIERFYKPNICKCGHDRFLHQKVGEIQKGECYAKCGCLEFVQFKVNRLGSTAQKVHEDGTTYDSKFEHRYAKQLEQRKRAGDIKDFETHKPIPLIVNGKHICKYVIDFVVEHNDGSIEYVETKGFKTEVWKMKWAIFEALYSDNRINKLTLVQQSGWRR